MAKINRIKYSFTDEELLDYLKLSALNNGGYPKQSDFTITNTKYPSLSTIKRRFGSWSEGCKLAGFTKDLGYLTSGCTLSLRYAIEVCFDISGYTVAKNNKNINKQILLDAIATTSDVPTFLGFKCRKTGCKFIKRTFPDKPDNAKSYNWLLLKNNWLCCSDCNLVKTTVNFYKNNSSLGYDLRCKECQEPDRVARGNIRRAKKLHATVSWSDLATISSIYNNCPEGYVVDHIIPLQGKYICGLHVVNNLQYLTASENNKKSNYHESEELW